MQGSPRRTSAKFKQPGELLLIKGLDYFPKPLNDFVSDIELPFVVSIGLPILDVYVGNSVKQHFHFIRLKHLNIVLNTLISCSGITLKSPFRIKLIERDTFYLHIVSILHI